MKTCQRFHSDSSVDNNNTIGYLICLWLEKNAREHRRVNQKGTIQRNWQNRLHKTKTNKAKILNNMCEYHYTQTNTNTSTINKT